MTLPLWHQFCATVLLLVLSHLFVYGQKSLATDFSRIYFFKKKQFRVFARMKLIFVVLMCLAATALATKKLIKDEETFGIKNILFYKMLFGDKLWMELVKEMTVEEKLMFDLLKVYNKHINPPGLTNLKFFLSFLCTDVDKNTLQVTSRVTENYEWMDTRLVWNPTDYNNIKEIRFPANMIWTPDMKLFNSHMEVEMRDIVNVVIKHDGTVLWVPLVTYKTNCLTTTNVKFPSDSMIKQNVLNNEFMCNLVIGSWTYDKTILKLTTMGEGLVKDEYLDTCKKHEITGFKVMIKDHIYPCCPNELYPALHLEFKVLENVI